MLRLSDLKIGIDTAADAETERQALRKLVLSQLKISDKELIDFQIFKKSIDARKKDKILFVYTIDVEVHNEARILVKHSSQGITPTPDLSYKGVPLGTEDMTERPVVIGMGPAGLFAGLLLARNGYNPIILERGEDVETISDYGQLSDKTISTDDVTEEYYDAEARLKALEAKETRLLALFDKANTITDIVNIEKELGAVRGDIEVIKGRLKYLTNATSFSTVNVALEQGLSGTLKAPQGTLGKAWQGLITSLNTLVDFGSSLIVFLVVILPWIVVIGLIFFLIRYLYRRYKKPGSTE
jgi:hypothetical protein